ncbi:hypothetical protein [Halopseudomonas litoralis]|nr:hypothetical protein [Halopseudomonas litoralis]
MKKSCISGRITTFHQQSIHSMSLAYEVMRLFASPQGHLVEIKRHDQMANTSDSGHEWLWVTNRSVSSLHPSRIEGEMHQVQTFREAQLQLVDQHAELLWFNGDRFTLEARQPLTLPPEQRQLIHNHLS